MTRIGQRVLVLAIGAFVLAGVVCLSGVSPASAQSPTGGPNVGFPFNTEFPYVGPASVSGGSYPAGVTYPSLTEDQSVFPLAAYQPGATLNVIPNPIQIVDSVTAEGLTRIVGSQTNGGYCKDKSGGQVWVPTGAPSDPMLSC